MHLFHVQKGKQEICRLSVRVRAVCYECASNKVKNYPFLDVRELGRQANLVSSKIPQNLYYTGFVNHSKIF